VAGVELTAGLLQMSSMYLEMAWTATAVAAAAVDAVVELPASAHAAAAAADAAAPAPNPRACCTLFPVAFSALAPRSGDEEIPSLHTRIVNITSIARKKLECANYFYN